MTEEELLTVNLQEHAGIFIDRFSEMFFRLLRELPRLNAAVRATHFKVDGLSLEDAKTFEAVQIVANAYVREGRPVK